MLVPCPDQNWGTTQCRLSSTAYSMYLHLSCISRGRRLHPQPKDPLYRRDRDQLKMAVIYLRNVMSNFETVRFLFATVIGARMSSTLHDLTFHGSLTLR